MLAAPCALSRKTENALTKEIARRGKNWDVRLWGRTELDMKVRAHPEVQLRFFGAHTSAGLPDVDSEIDEAFRYVNEGRPDIAIKILSKLKRKYWDRLSPRQRYRVLANLGTAMLANGKPEEAGRFYIQAAKHQPTDEDGRAFEAHGYLLLGDVEKAYELAVSLCLDSPGLSRAHVVRVHAAPRDLGLDEILDSVPLAQRNHPDVALALHDRAAAENRLIDAERILRASDMELLRLILALGTTLVRQKLDTIPDTFEVRPCESERLIEAKELFTKVLNEIPENDPENLAFAAYFNRGTCWRYLGDLEKARDDFRCAHRRNPEDERGVISLARSLYPEGVDLDGAISLLDDYFNEHTSAEVEVLLVECLKERNTGGDLERARRMLESLVPKLSKFEDAGFRAHIVAMLAIIVEKIESGDTALHLVEDVSGTLLESSALHAILGD